jgi:ATP-dependent RNA helicase HrpB
MQPLPIDPFLPGILKTLRERKRVVIVAEPGAGKTTRVPPAIVREGLLGAPNDKVIMLQPRRVAARAAAARIASENGLRLGEEVGYQVRGERRLGRDTRLQILTEGILTRKLVEDPFLEGVGCVVLDEFHERHIDSDLCIGMLREICDSVREDLHLAVMSATLNAEAVANFLGGCPIVSVPGRLFPVQVEFAPPPVPVRFSLPQHIVAEIRRVLDEAADDAGDVLVFLPGLEEIRRSARELEGLAASRDLAILPLHGALPFDAQARVLEPLPERKVILATNIAETSLTIDGVRTVIDSGLARVPSYDPRRGMDRLDLKRISRASAKQRAGRAGRTAPGRCVRLWSQAEDKNLNAFEVPEVERIDLCSAILHLHEWGKSDPREFGWFEAPPEHTVASSEQILAMLGALEKGKITPLGQRMLQIPAHPRLARLMVAAGEKRLSREAATIAAILSEKEMLLTSSDLGQKRTRDTQGRSDVLHRLHLLEVAERTGFSHSLRDQGIDPSAARQVARTRDELGRGSRSIGSSGTERSDATEDDLLKLVLLAYPDRVCKRRESNPDSATMVGGFGVKIDPASIVVSASLFVAVDARDDVRSNTREAVSRVLSEVDPAWFAELFPHLLSTTREVQMDESTGKVQARIITRFADLPIKEQTDHHAEAADIASALASVVRKSARAIFDADKKAGQVLQRLAFVRQHVPERGWPEFGDVQLGEVLAQSCTGKRSLQQVKEQDLAELLLNELEWKQRQQLEELAPETITVPSGSHIRLEYDGDRQPALAVRLQEVFGWLQSPRIAAGRVPLVMELLGPNFRPVQITSDLASFWKTAYFEVRKDLRVRYPKHSWPEDPLTAKPEAKGRPRR